MVANRIDRRPPETLDERKAWQRTLYEAGFVGMGWPKEYGGQSARPMEQAIVAEEMALANVPGAINSLGLGIVGPTLIAHGTEAQKQRYIKTILTADEIWCQLYSEPDAGSDLASLKTRAVRDNGDFVVNGQKVWTSLGADRRLRHPAGPHGPERPEAQGHLVLHPGHAQPGRRGAAAQADHRQHRVLRSLLRPTSACRPRTSSAS